MEERADEKENVEKGAVRRYLSSHFVVAQPPHDENETAGDLIPWF